MASRYRRVSAGIAVGPESMGMLVRTCDLERTWMELNEPERNRRGSVDLHHMNCLTCEYRLAGLDSDRCPECGRRFDPADSSTFDAHRRGPRALVGFGLAILVLGLAVLGLWLTVPLQGLQSRFVAFWLVFGVGLALGFAAAVLAGWNRSWLGRIPLLFVGTIAVWAGLALGHDKYYRVWQAMPNAPDEAYSDAGPSGTLIAGWIPGGILVVAMFVPALLWFAWRRRRLRRRLRAHEATTRSGTS